MLIYVSRVGCQVNKSNIQVIQEEQHKKQFSLQNRKNKIKIP